MGVGHSINFFGKSQILTLTLALALALALILTLTLTSGADSRCVGRGFNMDEYCTNNGNLPVGLDCNGKDGDDLWTTVTRAANVYNPPKFYSSQV